MPNSTSNQELFDPTIHEERRQYQRDIFDETIAVTIFSPIGEKVVTANSTIVNASDYGICFKFEKDTDLYKMLVDKEFSVNYVRDGVSKAGIIKWCHTDKDKATKIGIKLFR